MNLTAINWTDFTWNAASGCTEVSPECAHCYAKTLAENKRGTKAFPNGFDVTLRPWKLDEPRKIKKPSLVFSNSMTDMFHVDIPDSYRDDILAAMLRAPQHRYQVLTKRPETAARYFETRKVPECMWLGVTVGVQRTVDRVAVLRSIDARVRFLSCEPLLEQIELDLAGIAWVIGGGESGNHASDPKILHRRFLVRRGDRKNGEALWMPREDKLRFARSLRDQTKAAGAAFWWKQHGGPRPTSAGRVLDGRTWDEMPSHIEGAMPGGADYVHRTDHHAQRRLPLVG